ncbi:oligosaccharide flippase family protein [Glutamicibacter protophormiae]|uniref:oligosaccharide flippase family protein n=1 Tax=Glutamicibacter protophormiae TaxID=37930 RepID=UPI0033215258
MAIGDGTSATGTTKNPEDQLRGVAKSGIISLAGSMTSAVMGFSLILVLGRLLGEMQSGIVLQAIAVFSIALAIARLGMDTTSVWLLPRLKIASPEQIRPAITRLLLPTAALGLLGALVLWFGAPFLASEQGGAGELVSSVRALAWALPAGAVMMVSLQITRGLGNINPFALIGNVFVPSLRPLFAVLVVAIGGTAVAVSFSWAVPLLLGALAALWVVGRRASKTSRLTADPQIQEASAEKPLGRRIWGFAMPRWYASILEQSITWFDVVVVGIIAGASAAGVYGAASRFVTAGLIVSTAMRIVVSPRFSSLLAQGKHTQVQHLYTTTIIWVVLFGTPIFVTFGFFAETILGWLGPGFEAGASVLVMLSVSTVGCMMFGNADSLLMMSGRSGLLAMNKTIVLAVNIVGNILLIPIWGIEGAGIVWSVSMLLNCVLAATQNKIALGIDWEAKRILYCVIVATLCSAIPCFMLSHFMGQNTVSLVLAVLVLLTFLAFWCFMDRRRLGLNELMKIRRSEPSA